MTNKFIQGILLVLSLSVLSVSCGKGSDAGQTEGRKTGASIVEAGELAAINSKAFTMPRFRYWNQMRITGLLEHGTIVQPGDSIIQLDDTDVKRFIIDNEAQLETQLAAQEKMMINQQNSRNDVQSRIRSEQAAFELKELALKSSEFESERNRTIRGLEHEQAVINLKKEQNRRAFQTVMDSIDLRIQKIRIQQLRNEIQSAFDILPQLTIRTPIGGVFQVARSGNGIFVKIGDVKYQGNRLANVPDLDQMKVETFIGETDFLKIYEGQSVIVRLDAMPKIVFNGTITYIGKLCRPREYGSRQKGFDVVVEITGHDERLKPGMTVSCEFLDIR